LRQAGRARRALHLHRGDRPAHRWALLRRRQRADRDLFKLYPWEWLFRERYASALAGSRCQFIEPPWKALLSNKGLLACLWEMEPGHPNLLPAFFEGDPRCERLSPRRVRKPLYSREGANITLLERGTVLDSDDGPYGAEGFILQDAATNLFESDGNYAVIGSWLVASQACGLCIREDFRRSPRTPRASCRTTSSHDLIEP
jgi:glutathionylspermidine synthase